MPHESRYDMKGGLFFTPLSPTLFPYETAKKYPAVALRGVQHKHATPLIVELSTTKPHWAKADYS